jgi:hypothetical protein
MTDFLYEAHAGWRYLAYLALLVAFVFFAFLLITRSDRTKYERVVGIIFAVVIDIQITLGIILLIIQLLDGIFLSRTIGHVVIMLLVLPIIHAYSFYARRNPDKLRNQRIIGMVAPVLAVVLIIGGLMAIDASLFG